MTRRHEAPTPFACLVACTALVLPALAAAPDPAYVDDLAKFRKRADASLTRERGWLSIVSRDELGPGTYRIGSATDNQIVLPKDLAPAYLGTVTASKDKARLSLANGQTRCRSLPRTSRARSSRSAIS